MDVQMGFVKQVCLSPEKPTPFMAYYFSGPTKSSVESIVQTF